MTKQQNKIDEIGRDELYNKLMKFVRNNKREVANSIQSNVDYHIIYKVDEDKVYSFSTAGNTQVLEEGEVLLYKNKNYSYWEASSDIMTELLNLKEAVKRGYLEVDEEDKELLSTVEHDSEITDKYEKLYSKYIADCDDANLHIALDECPEAVFPKEEIKFQFSN